MTTFSIVVSLAAKVLSEHRPTTGMRVAMGETCRCGYWNGTEEPGVTRPVGLQGLDWHQAQELERASLLVTKREYRYLGAISE